MILIRGIIYSRKVTCIANLVQKVRNKLFLALHWLAKVEDLGHIHVIYKIHFNIHPPQGTDRSGLADK